MTLWSNKMWLRAYSLAFVTNKPAKRRQKFPRRQDRSLHFLHATVILACLASSIIPQCQGFFFPKSFFRKGNDNPPPQPPQQRPRVLAGGHGNSVQNSFGGEHLQGSGTDVQPALRIVNRPPLPPRNNEQIQQPGGPVPGAGFHVPKELCLACERFPWTPVAGGERPGIGAASTSVSHVQQHNQQSFISNLAQGSAPTKTIVINALGEAAGPVPVPPVLPSRRPFAIQFDGSQSGNKVNYQNAVKQVSPPPQLPPSVSVAHHDNFSQTNPDKPVTFQIYQAQSPKQQPTLLQQSTHPIGLQPPPFTQTGLPSTYGRPTVLFPVNAQSVQVGANVNVQTNYGSAPPPNPLAVGTIVASQQNNIALPQFQKIEPAKLVYQEHFTAQGSSPPPSPQNFKVPIIPHQGPGLDVQIPSDNLATNSIVPPSVTLHGTPPQQNYGAQSLQNQGPSPQQNQGPPQNFGQPPQPNQGPPQNFGQPPQSNQGPPQNFGHAPQPNQGPPQNFGHAPQPNQGPPQNFGQPPQQNQGPPQNFGQPPQQNQGPPQNFGQPPQPNQGPPQNFAPPPQQNYGAPPQQVHGSPSQHSQGPLPQQIHGSSSQQNYGAPPPEDNYRPSGLFLQMRPPVPFQPYQHAPRPSLNMKPPGPLIHYGKPVRIPNNIGPQRPSGQVIFPPPQAFLQMGPPPPVPQAPNPAYGIPRPDVSNTLDSSVRPQEERRPSPSGQILNVQLPQQQTNRPPTQGQALTSNSIQPVPIPILTPLQTSNGNAEFNKNQNNQGPNNADATFTQETGWEIIPSIQTDLTHLFSPEKGKPSSQVSKELPVPVPIPVPQSHPPKSPFFIVAGAGQQQQQQAQHHEHQIKVQDVTYHEESRNPVPNVSVPLGAVNNVGLVGNQEQQREVHQQPQQQQEHNLLHTNSVVENDNQQNIEQEARPQYQPISQQVIRPRPFILGVPTGSNRPIIFRPHPQQPQPFQQLHPSIMTALNHAQQTSLLTHQYFRQPNLGQSIRENTIYVSPVVGVTASKVPNSQQIETNAQQSESVSGSVQQETHEGNNLEQQHPVNLGIDPRIPSGTSSSADQNNPNCQGNQDPYLIPITTHQSQQQQQAAEDDLQQQQQQTQEVGQVDQSISSPSGFAPGTDDHSQSFGGSGKDNAPEEDISSPSNLVAPEPTHATSLASAPPTAAITTVSSSGISSPSGIRSSISVQDNGNKGSYLIYYPRPVSKSPVYWVQPSRTQTQGVVRLSPQITPVSPSVSSVVTWSRPRVVVANQFRTEQQQQRNENPKSHEPRSQESYEKGEETEGSDEQSQSSQISVEHNDDDNIPFGQKLGVTRDSNKIQTPYDIISVGGSDDEAQSLEEESSSSDHTQGRESVEQTGKAPYGSSDISLSGPDESTGIGNDQQIDINSGSSREYPEEGQQQQVVQNENNLQSVQQETKTTHQEENEDADDERDDFGFRPQTVYRKPVSTTVIHSPGASSFQSLKLPNFKPHRVIVHDFTAHSATAAATGPSAAASEQQQSFDSSKTQGLSSGDSTSNAWTASQKLKLPKLVESNDDEEESSESIHRPQGFNIQEVIASGPVSTADCLTTAHSGHLHTSYSSTSPRTTESLGSLTSAKGRDIFLPIGSRFPGGRPSIFSAIRRPISTQSPVSTSITTTSSTDLPSSLSENEHETFSTANNKRERYLGQSPSGFAASIPVPVYRRPISITQDVPHREESHVGGGGGNSIHSEGVTYVKPQPNVILAAEDIYKTSELKEERVFDKTGSNDPIRITESSTSLSSNVDSETIDSLDEIMSTERSSSFSVSVVDEKSGGLTNNKDEHQGTSSFVSFGNNDNLQQVGPKPLHRVNVVQVTSIPVISEAEPITTTASTLTVSSSGERLMSTTAIPLPASTSTKIVKTVRVRQRMRSGSFNGPLRTRFHGGSRVRVVHRPANQEYIRHFPEFATHEGDKLAKEEEQEVKNALIELKKSTEPVKTH